MFESVVAQRLAERGIQQGRQQGRQQGSQQERVLSVLDLISERFSPNDADKLKPRLESIEDLEILRQMLVKVSNAKTFSEFEQALNAVIS